MTTVHETIPEKLRPEVEAALAWFNAHEGGGFEVTGILDPELSQGEAHTLRLVLCSGDRCEQRSFRVAPSDGGYDVALAQEATAAGEVAPELDPPPGALRGWLEREQSRHRFVVLVFYRGFW